MKRLLIILALCLLLVGCARVGPIEYVPESDEEITIEQTGDGTKITIEEDEEETEIEIEADMSGDWCNPGDNWEVDSTKGEAMASATWKVVELVSSGQFEGLCHTFYTAVDEDGEELQIDYYFNEDSDVMYAEATVDGQKIVTHPGNF